MCVLVCVMLQLCVVVCVTCDWCLCVGGSQGKRQKNARASKLMTQKRWRCDRTGFCGWWPSQRVFHPHQLVTCPPLKNHSKITNQFHVAIYNCSSPFSSHCRRPPSSILSSCVKLRFATCRLAIALAPPQRFAAAALAALADGSVGGAARQRRYVAQGSARR